MTGELISLGLPAVIFGNLVFIGTKFQWPGHNGRLSGVRWMLWIFALAFLYLFVAQVADVFFEVPWMFERLTRTITFRTIFLAGTGVGMWGLRLRRAP